MITQLIDKYRPLAELWIRHNAADPDCLPVPVQPTDLLKLINAIEELIRENTELKSFCSHTGLLKAQEEHNAQRERLERAEFMLNWIFDEVDSGSDVWYGTKFMETDVGPFLNRKMFWQKEQP